MPTAQKTHRLLKARWLLPIDQPPIEGGALLIEDGKIGAVLNACQSAEAERNSSAETEITDYAEAVIVPGLINLHTHLEYSSLRHLAPGAPLFQWIETLVGATAQWQHEDFRQAAVIGAQMVANAGTTCVVDSAPRGEVICAIAETGLRAVVGLELFGLSEETAAARFDDWQCRYQALLSNPNPAVQAAFKAERIKVTVAPHTPYTVCPSLIKMAAAWAKERSLPLLMHVSESAEECRWIAAGDQTLDAFLSKMVMARQPGYKQKDNSELFSWRGQGLTPFAHLHQHGILHEDLLAAHAVHVTDEDLQLCARHAVKIAHCARSNARLGNGFARLQAFKDAGLTFGFGTDSLASTDDLDLLAEARFSWSLAKAVDRDFSLDSREALYRLTMGAATAIGQSDKIGSLKPGKCADLAVFDIDSLPIDCRQRPYDAILWGAVRLRDLYVDGRKVVSKAV